MSELQKLSDNATPGEWRIHDATLLENDRAEFAAECWDGMATGPHNARFIVALVNAYREGRLRELQPGEGVWRRITQAEEDAEAAMWAGPGVVVSPQTKEQR